MFNDNFKGYCSLQGANFNQQRPIWPNHSVTCSLRPLRVVTNYHKAEISHIEASYGSK